MHPSSELLKPLTFRDAMEIHLEKPEDGTLFRLPDDILACIVQDLIDSGVDFRPLSKLSPSFRQLARTVLFRVVTFDTHPKCYNGILAFLHAEAFERLQNRRIQGQTQTPSLGACVRKVVVDPWNIRNRITCSIAHFEAYHDPLIHQVISSLPNLDALELVGVTISQSLLNCLVGSTVRSVNLGARMSAICPRIRLGVFWPITNLSLKFLADNYGSSSRSLYCESILRLCAPTLQCLTISHPLSTTTTRRQLSFNLNFPDLIFLDILEADLGRPALESLLLTSKKLHDLRIDCTQASVREVMSTPDKLHALRILVLRWQNEVILDDMPRRPLSFIASLGQVHSLAFSEPSPQELSEQILEDLHHFCFHRLEGLTLVWDRTCTPERLLEGLSTRGNESLTGLRLILEETESSSSFFLDPRNMQVLEASCRRLKYLRLTGLGRRMHPGPYVLQGIVEAYWRMFPKLELVRLYGDLFIREDWQWTFLDGA